jgi:hypothetical protein
MCVKLVVSGEGSLSRLDNGPYLRLAGRVAQVESGRVDGFERPQEREERGCRLRVPSCWLAQPVSRVLKAAVSG